MNGSVDMLTWFSQRLQMDYVWGPAADSAWGNALLSRFPIAGHGNYAMPNNDALRLDRAFLTVEVDVGGGEVLDVVATHFHSGVADSALRVPQSLAVLQAIDATQSVVLLRGPERAPRRPGDATARRRRSERLIRRFRSNGRRLHLSLRRSPATHRLRLG